MILPRYISVKSPGETVSPTDHVITDTNVASCREDRCGLQCGQIDFFGLLLHTSGGDAVATSTVMKHRA